jgi:hypothetical protein
MSFSMLFLLKLKHISVVYLGQEDIKL